MRPNKGNPFPSLSLPLLSVWSFVDAQCLVGGFTDATGTDTHTRARLQMVLGKGMVNAPMGLVWESRIVIEGLSI